MNTWLMLAGSLVFYGLVMYLLIFRNRRWNRRARVERRLLVQEEGQRIAVEVVKHRKG